MRGSKNSALPKSTFSGVTMLSFRAGTVDGRGKNISSATSRSSSSASAWPAVIAASITNAVPVLKIISWYPFADSHVFVIDIRRRALGILYATYQLITD